MRADVGSLKSGQAQLVTDLAGVRTSLATLTERVAHLPSKGFIVGAVITGLAVIAGVTAFITKLAS
jgi:hypothetical protein